MSPGRLSGRTGLKAKVQDVGATPSPPDLYDWKEILPSDMTGHGRKGRRGSSIVSEVSTAFNTFSIPIPITVSLSFSSPYPSSASDYGSFHYPSGDPQGKPIRFPYLTQLDSSLAFASSLRPATGSECSELAHKLYPHALIMRDFLREQPED